MPVYNLEQYITNDNVLDLSDIITKKLLLNSSSFTLFNQELNDFLLKHPLIHQLTINPSLLTELIGKNSDTLRESTILTMPHIRKLKIKATKDLFNYNNYCTSLYKKMFYNFLHSNPQLKEIDCRDDSIEDCSTITYPNRDMHRTESFLTLLHSGNQSQDTFLTDDLFCPHSIHLGLLEHYYGMSPREIAFYFEWNNLQGEATVKGLPAIPRSTEAEKAMVGLKATDPLMYRGISIPRIELPNLQVPPTREQEACLTTMAAEIPKLLQPSFIIKLANTLFDQARNPDNLCLLSIAVAGLIAVSLSANIVLATSIGVVSGIGFYSLGRHSILPTRANAMQDYISVLSDSFRKG